jgi:sec-independent protein translocase protein TatB
MFGIDFSEVLLIFGIALVVLGPERLPRLAQTIGRWIGRARAMARQFREQLEAETHTLREGVDPGPEFSGRPGARAGSGGAVPRPTASSGTDPAAPAADSAAPRIDPRPPAGRQPATMVGPPLPQMSLADTHPAGFHPYVPPAAPAATPSPQADAARPEAAPVTVSSAPHEPAPPPSDGAP